MNLVTPREPSSRRVVRERLASTQQVRRISRWSHLAVASASSPGLRHTVNEDAHSGLAGTAPVFVVADGVGGGAMAAWASRQLVKRLHAALERRAIDESALRDALRDADRAVGRGIARRTAGSGAATVALCAGTGRFLSRWFIGWVGDCRVYRVGHPRGDAHLITRDDTYRNLGEIPPPGGSPDDPARMVGNGAVGEPNVERVELGAGETLLLCSDGVHKHVSADDIARVLRAREPLAQRCLHLLEMARAHGSVDDATVLVVRRDRSRRDALWRYGCAGVLIALLSGALIALWPQAQQLWSAPTDPAAHSELQPELRA